MRPFAPPEFRNWKKEAKKIVVVEQPATWPGWSWEVRLARGKRWRVEYYPISRESVKSLLKQSRLVILGDCENAREICGGGTTAGRGGRRYNH